MARDDRLAEVFGDDLNDLDLTGLLEVLADVNDDDLVDVIDSLPASAVEALLARVSSEVTSAAPSPLAQAQAIDPAYQQRDHLTYLSDRLRAATEEVEAGANRQITVSMPPRAGKSQQVSIWLPVWLLARNPTWKIGLISHSPTLAASWGRAVRRVVEDHGAALNVSIAKDAGAVQNWQTTQGGGVSSRSVGQSIIGEGFDVLIIDDAVKDFAAAHSSTQRDAIWEWWIGNAVHRLEPPYLVVVVGTRWHEDDLIGRLLSDEYEGDPTEWEVISFPAIAEENDVLGRSPGEPLISPLINETREQALMRWADMRRSVGEYIWAALFQQRPAPARGAIVNLDRLRYWSSDSSLPALEDAAAEDRVAYFDPDGPDARQRGQWLDSWDLGVTGGDTADYTVGQRWVRVGPHRVLVAQARGRWTFGEILTVMRSWSGLTLTEDEREQQPTPGPFTHHAPPGTQFVARRLIEQAANGAAAIDTLKRKVSGIVAVKPRDSKEVRLRVVTPEVESRLVVIPNPSDPGNEWVGGLIDELREFPHGRNDDQVDTFSQALAGMRDAPTGTITNPARASTGQPIQRRLREQVASDAARRRGGASSAPPPSRRLSSVRIPGR